MKQYLQITANYMKAHKKMLTISVSSIFIIIVLITSIVLVIKNSATKIIYQPTSACNSLTREDAQKLLGSNTIHSNIVDPVLSGNTTTSKCAYTDGNPDVNNMVVAAIIVRSGINEQGVLQNKTEFTAGKPSNNIEPVQDLGDDAYFNQALGQLNILNDRNWIILSYGIGSAPETNTVDKAIELARKITPTFLTSKF